MSTQPVLTATDTAALEQLKRDLPRCRTWQLLETLHALEPLARTDPTIRVLYAAIGGHLTKRHNLDAAACVRHPEGPAAGVAAELRGNDVITAATN
jgi:hypothetical protein